MIGGIIVVALSVLTAVVIIKRRHGRKQGGPVPTANPLLDDPRLTELAAQRSKYYIKFDRFHLLILDIELSKKVIHQVPSASGSPTQRQSTLELAMQRQIDMMQSMSQRINLMALEFGALEFGAQQRGHQDTNREPPDYESQA